MPSSKQVDEERTENRQTQGRVSADHTWEPCREAEAVHVHEIEVITRLSSGRQPPSPCPRPSVLAGWRRTRGRTEMAWPVSLFLPDLLPVERGLGHLQTLTPTWSPQGSFKELVYVFFMVKDAGLTPDLLSYAAALQCMGRLDQDTSTIQRWVGSPALSGGWSPPSTGPCGHLAPRPIPWVSLRPPCAPCRCLDQMARDGLKLQGLFTSVPLRPEEQAVVLRAVRKAQPTFSPPPPPQPPPQVNTSPLLREIYAKVSRP